MIHKITLAVATAFLGVAVAGCDVDVQDSGEPPEIDTDVRDAGEVPDVDVDVQDKGRLPDVETDVQPGRAPDVDVQGPDVDVESRRERVTVPDVDVDVDEQQRDITLPDVDVTPPPDDEPQGAVDPAGQPTSSP